MKIVRQNISCRCCPCLRWRDLNMTSWFARYSNLIWFIISLKFSILISLLRQVVMAAVTHEHGVNLRHGRSFVLLGLDTETQTSLQFHRDVSLIVSQRNCRSSQMISRSCVLSPYSNHRDWWWKVVTENPWSQEVASVVPLSADGYPLVGRRGGEEEPPARHLFSDHYHNIFHTQTQKFLLIYTHKLLYYTMVPRQKHRDVGLLSVEVEVGLNECKSMTF